MRINYKGGVSIHNPEQLRTDIPPYFHLSGVFSNGHVGGIVENDGVHDDGEGGHARGADELVLLR